MSFTHLKHLMVPYIRFLELLRPTNMALSAWMISLASNMPTEFALSGVIAGAAIDVNLEPQHLSGCPMAYFDWFPMC